MAIAIFLPVAVLTSLWVSWLIIVADRHRPIGRDETHGVQKFHVNAVPRLGGVAVFVGLISALLALAWTTRQYKQEVAFMIIALLPAFGMGLVEDLTRRAGEVSRLIATMISAALGWWLLKAGLVRISWAPADVFLAQHLWAGFMMTLFAAAGSAQAINLIDGCHGLSGFFIMAALAALSLIAGTVGDAFVQNAALVGIAATAGFFLFNFPRGRIFLGDAGAYMMGFYIAQLGMILVTRHPEVSPWSIMLIMAYPAWEMMFSIYRRALNGLRHVGKPDARHLHQLVYRRVLKWAPKQKFHNVRDFRSSATSVSLWPMMLLCTVPAVLFWNQSAVLFWLCWLFALTYTVIYLAIARFKVPRPVTRFVETRKARFEQKRSAGRSGAAEQLQH